MGGHSVGSSVSGGATGVRVELAFCEVGLLA